MSRSARPGSLGRFGRAVSIGVAVVLVVILVTWGLVGADLLRDSREHGQEELRSLASLHVLAHAQTDSRAIRASSADPENLVPALDKLIAGVSHAVSESHAELSAPLETVLESMDDLLVRLRASQSDVERGLLHDELDLRLEQLLRLQTNFVRDSQAVTEANLESGVRTASMITVAVVLGFALLAGIAVVGLRRAETSLLESEERWRATFDAAATGVFLVEVDDGVLVDTNPAAQQMLGYEPRELATMRFTDVIHQDDVYQVRSAMADLISDSANSVRARARYQGEGGRSGHGLVSVALVKDSHGTARHAVAHVVDVSDQVHAESRLHALVESKDELIASVSHELRTPLTTVLGYAELLRDEFARLTEGERTEAIETIANWGSDLANIVDDLLVAARADTGSLVVAATPVDLRNEAQQVVAGIRTRSDGRTVEFHGGRLHAVGDPARVRQIIRNLITNAYRYGGDAIRVTVARQRGSVTLQVSDDGPGVPRERTDHIFELYGRAHMKAGVTASIGLGLTVSRVLARLMGGDLTYRREDGDTVFSLELPALDGSLLELDPVGDSARSGPHPAEVDRELGLAPLAGDMVGSDKEAM